jgi:hypothetical protein
LLGPASRPDGEWYRPSRFDTILTAISIHLVRSAGGLTRLAGFFRA